MKPISPRIVLATLGLMSIPVGLVVHAATTNLQPSIIDDGGVLIRRPSEMDYNPFQAPPSAAQGSTAQSSASRLPTSGGSTAEATAASELQRLPTVESSDPANFVNPSRFRQPEVNSSSGTVRLPSVPRPTAGTNSSASPATSAGQTTTGQDAAAPGASSSRRSEALDSAIARVIANSETSQPSASSANSAARNFVVGNPVSPTTMSSASMPEHPVVDSLPIGVRRSGNQGGVSQVAAQMEEEAAAASAARIPAHHEFNGAGLQVATRVDEGESPLLNSSGRSSINGPITEIDVTPRPPVHEGPSYSEGTAFNSPVISAPVAHPMRARETNALDQSASSPSMAEPVMSLEPASSGESNRRGGTSGEPTAAVAYNSEARQDYSIEPIPSSGSIFDSSAPTYSYDNEVVQMPNGMMGNEIVDGELLSDPFMDPLAGPCDGGCPSKWYGIGEYVVYQPEMERVHISSVIDTNQEFFRSGGRATIGYRSDCLRGWEASFLMLETGTDIASSVEAGIPGALSTRWFPTRGLNNFDVSNFNGNNIEHIQSHRFDYADLELNRVTWGWDVFNTKCGIRVSRMEEGVSLGSGPIGTPLENMPGLFNQDIENFLFGPQFGISFIDDSRGRWTVDTNLGVAGYLNLINMDTYYRNNATGAVINNQGIDAVKAAVSGEASVGIAYHLTPGLKIRAGIDAIYYYGLGTIEDNLEEAPSPFVGSYLLTPGTGAIIRNSDDLFLWGGTVGIYGNWP